MGIEWNGKWRLERKNVGEFVRCSMQLIMSGIPAPIIVS